MSVPRYRRSRFDDHGEDPLGPLANLVDIVLVFAVGLILALVAAGNLGEGVPQGGADVDRGRELPDMPDGVGEQGSGYEPVGQVYRDPETGRLILIGD